MEREANYLAVGSFVLLVLVMGVLFVYWYSASSDHRHYVRYEIYFDGSVSGLSEGGPVRYLGVDVGRVVRIRIDPRAANRVQVIADIDATTPISIARWRSCRCRVSPACCTSICSSSAPMMTGGASWPRCPASVTR
jgi:phospholipid/cholesterol/gamma-HCH transport system substrate-binding protein